MKNILNKLSNVIITIVVALIVYCVCVPSPAHATTCKEAVRVDTYSYNNNFVEVVNDGSRIVTYNDENIIEKYSSY